MTNTIKITTEFATALQQVGQNGWVIINEDCAVGAYKSRNEARTAKAEQGFTGKIVKASEVTWQVIDLKASTNDGLLDAQHGDILRASTIESPCFVVWDTADKMQGARRKDVIAACVAKGVAFYTARTQYQLWLSSKKADEAQAAANKTRK